MAVTARAIYLTFIATAWLSTIVVYSYFASVVNNELEPHFKHQGQHDDAENSYLVYIFFVFGAVWAGLNLPASALAAVLAWFNATWRHDHVSFCTNLYLFSTSLAIVICSVLVAKATWTWWHELEAQEFLHLAQHCKVMSI
ncbi:hypothetical protein JX266_006126 [Neoarthrinium moseri]|nr:hypothetical protein JX266_006126 [Neoarthrinium moseri]